MLLETFSSYLGLPGQNGFIGPRGMDGKKGDRGSKGDQGPMGLPGPMGFRGDSGNTGAVGKPGYPVSSEPFFFNKLKAFFYLRLLLTSNSPHKFIFLPQVRDTNLYY